MQKCTVRTRYLAPSTASPVDTPRIHGGSIEPGHSKSHIPHTHHQQTERPDTELETFPTYGHTKHREYELLQHTGQKVAGHLSRRAILGLTGVTVAVAVFLRLLVIMLLLHSCYGILGINKESK